MQPNIKGLDLAGYEMCCRELADAGVERPSSKQGMVAFCAMQAVPRRLQFIPTVDLVLLSLVAALHCMARSRPWIRCAVLCVSTSVYATVHNVQRGKQRACQQ